MVLSSSWLSSWLVRLTFASVATFILVASLDAGVAIAAPEAHILRIDPRAGMQSDAPVLTTLIELVQFKSMSEAFVPCASIKPFNQRLDCMSDILEAPKATWSTFAFPKDKAQLLVKVDGQDRPATMEGEPQTWAASLKDPRVGTAWLVVLDAAAGMGARYGEAREVANDFIRSMQPNDLMNIMIFDDQAVFHSSKGWKTYAQRQELANTLKDVPQTGVSHGRDRALFEQIKKMTVDGFNDLGNTTSTQAIPLHQALVILSNGAGRNDVSSSAPNADVFHAYANKGRFPEDNPAAPKTPVPVISIWFPSASSLLNDIYKNNDLQFMQALANPEIGGFFDIVREMAPGEVDARSARILKAVRTRFDAMYVVKWRLGCLNADVQQSFDLEFNGTVPPIKGDASFDHVPIGVDPSQWPLSIDVGKTRSEAEANPVYPGGTFKVYGDFCWAGDKSRAEAYFIPTGTSSAIAGGTDIGAAKKAMQALIGQNMRGTAKDTNDTFAIFDVPDDPKVLDGQGDNILAHVIILDNKAYRSSGRDAKSILTLKAKKAPLNLVIILGAVGGGVVILLLVIVLLRGGGGGGGGRKRGSTTPNPVVAGGASYGGPPGGGGYGGPPPGYGGAPPGGYGGPPQGGGGYGASSVSPPQASVAAAPPAQATTPLAASSSGAGPPAAAVSNVVQVRCPSCQMTTMATPGQPSVCFSCGQPLPASATGPAPGGGPSAQPPFPLTGPLAESSLTPPPSPYGPPNGPVNGTGNGAGARPSVTHATLVGPVGQFPIMPGSEVRVGRDASQCAVALNEPRISGVHSTLKFESANLWVRDEQSNNGTYIGGERIPPNSWFVVPAGRPLRFGPVEFDVRLES
jgi:hypothetical protein